MQQRLLAFGAYVVVCVGVALVSGGARTLVRYINSHGAELDHGPALSKAASRLNEGLPMMVDDETELMNVAGFANIMVYNYRLVNLAAAEVPDNPEVVSAWFREVFKPDTVRQVCSTPETRGGVYGGSR